MNPAYLREKLAELNLPEQVLIQESQHGCFVITGYPKVVQKFIAEQPEQQFTCVQGINHLSVRLASNKLVCVECGSPHFFTKVIEEYSSYIDPASAKARTTLFLMREVKVYCQLCATPKGVKVHRYPEVITC